MIDTHAHFNSVDLKDLKKEIETVNSRFYLDKVINVGLDYETSKEVIEISLREEKFYGTLGIHPLHEGKVSSLLELYQTSNCSKIVALGETGLDRSSPDTLKRQEQKLIETIELANFLSLPVIIHANNTNREVMDVLKKHIPKEGFVFHCFQPELEILDEILEMNGYISVGTPITRKTAKKSLEVIRKIPIENLLIELDYPYMSKESSQDGKNVFNKIKLIRGYSHQELESVLDENAKRLFKKLGV